MQELVGNIMVGYEKFLLKQKLESLGWEDVSTNEEEYKMVPPDSLWENKPEYFSIYGAIDLQIDLTWREEQSLK